ncbi:MAG: indole-3-glycerol phosphate synthase TrpC [Acidimicrobiia bacterium]
MLDRILKAADIRAANAADDIEDIKYRAATAPPVRSFIDALRGPGLGVIAEIKRRSPSVGDIDVGMDPVAQAIAYQEGGADAISVLTEPEHFGGSLDDLAAVRAAVTIPVLRKDFTRNAAQVWEARASGADAVLLIVAALESDRLVELLRTASAVGVDAIVEVHTANELERAAASGAMIIGVNNRDLKTFRTDLAVAEGIASHVPPTCVAIAESGVSTMDGAQRMARAGYDAILVGEALVRHPDPAFLVAELKLAE